MSLKVVKKLEGYGNGAQGSKQKMVRCKIPTTPLDPPRLTEPQMGPEAPVSSASAKKSRRLPFGGNAPLQPLSRRNQIQIERRSQVTYAPLYAAETALTLI
jgi:hypothetical protein